MTLGRPHNLPDIFTYIAYRAWLSDAFEAMRNDDPSLTHRAFSKRCGYRSSGAISLITSGRRRLSMEAARRIAKALGLDTAERQHLEYMVAFERAEDFEARDALLRKMQAAQRFAQVWSDTLDAYAFYRDWYLPVVREIVSLDDFREDPAWIAERICGDVTPEQAAEALEQLLNMGYLKRNAQGRLTPTQPIISTPSELRSDVLKQHQRHMMQLASLALEHQPRSWRDMRVVTMAISQSQAQRIKARMTQLQKEILAIVEEDEPIEVVYQLNTQWFALTEPTDLDDIHPSPRREDAS